MAVANALNAEGIATFLLDLLTPNDEDDRAKVFDIPLLAGRLVEAVRLEGATHLFPEPGAMDAVIKHAIRWFNRYLRVGTPDDR